MTIQWMMSVVALATYCVPAGGVQKELAHLAEGLQDVVLHDVKGALEITPETRELHYKNVNSSRVNYDAYQSLQQQKRAPGFFTLSLQQSASGYRTLTKCLEEVEKQVGQNLFQMRVSDDSRHCSLIVVAIPFSRSGLDTQHRAKEAEQARDTLEQIVRNYADEYLKGVSCTFDHFALIGKGKFFVANYDFSSKQDAQRFSQGYGRIIHEFFQKYPKAWMFYGYKPLIHISVSDVSSDKTLQQQLQGKTFSCAYPVRPFRLLHAGKNQKPLQVSYRYTPRGGGRFETESRDVVLP